MGRNDQYANIAISGISTEGKGLAMVTPPEFTPARLPVEPAEGPRTIFPSGMSTEEELHAALSAWKAKLAPFKARLAPALEIPRRRAPLDEFDWRIETPEDRRDFAGVLAGKGAWEKVRIPHFGEPLGSAATYYRAVFSVDAPGPDEAVFIHFCGVDYKAQVFVNGALAGTHEGFFAPFEFDISPYLREGENILLVRVENDFVQKRSPAEFGGP